MNVISTYAFCVSIFIIICILIFKFVKWLEEKDIQKELKESGFGYKK